MSMKDQLLITIDGPAGSGKSTLSRLLARRLSYLYLDTGALYRTFAYAVLQHGISSRDEAAVSRLCSTVKISFQMSGGELRIILDGRDVTDHIRTEEVGIAASIVSAYPAVRKELLPLQRDIGMSGGVVAEGRDMGTVVFPGADIKVYIDASPRERAGRRYRQLLGQGVDADFEEIMKRLEIRDRQDTQRDLAPLKPAKDAHILDTTDMEAADVVEVMIGIVTAHREKIKASRTVN